MVARWNTPCLTSTEMAHSHSAIAQRAQWGLLTSCPAFARHPNGCETGLPQTVAEAAGEQAAVHTRSEELFLCAKGQGLQVDQSLHDQQREWRGGLQKSQRGPQTDRLAAKMATIDQRPHVIKCEHTACKVTTLTQTNLTGVRETTLAGSERSFPSLVHTTT